MKSSSKELAPTPHMSDNKDPPFETNNSSVNPSSMPAPNIGQQFIVLDQASDTIQVDVDEHKDEVPSLKMSIGGQDDNAII